MLIVGGCGLLFNLKQALCNLEFTQALIMSRHIITEWPVSTEGAASSLLLSPFSLNLTFTDWKERCDTQVQPCVLIFITQAEQVSLLKLTILHLHMSF